MGRVPLSHSLRWRLPALIFVLVAVLLLTFLYAAYRQVEAALIRAAGERALNAATQVRDLLERSTQIGQEQLRRMAADPAVVRYAKDPTADSEAAAREALSRIAGSGPRSITVWNAVGARLLTIDVPAPSTTESAPSWLPTPTTPPAIGVGPLKVVGDAVFSDGGAAIAEPPSPAVPRPVMLGLLSTRSTARINPPGLLNRLVGSEASIAVANQTGDVWSDFSHPLPPERVDLGHDGTVEYRSATGQARVAAVRQIRGSPLAISVAFPKALVVTPARIFLIQMLAIGASFLLVSLVLVGWLTRTITTPLAAATVAADAMAAGDYSHRVPSERRDEIGLLGQAFNVMTEAVARELKARLTAEEALRDREASLRTLFAANPLPMWVYDIETLRFLEVNEAAIAQYGYTRDEFLAMRITEIRPQEDVPALIADLKGRGEDFRFSTTRRHRTKSGRLVDVDVVSHTMTFTGRPAALVVAQDITERLQLEAQLRQAQKMEAVGQLAGGVAHDFNNLLTAILGYCGLLLEDLEQDNPARGDVLEIQRAGESAATLTRQLLAFSRRQILQPEVLDLNESVRRTEFLLKRLIGEDITLETVLSPSLDHVSVDPGQIEQIVMNLAINARDAMPRGGRLTIETANVELDDAYARQHAGVVAGPHVMLAVSDTGVGMDAATQARIFEPFFTTKKGAEGTGLGLATVYGIVTQSGGSIFLYSEPQKGTTFKIYLPRTTAPAERPTSDVPQPAVTGTETILLAEDQAEVRTVARTALERQGYTVLEAANGQEALRTLREYKAPIHLLLTDVVMPELSGRELVDEQRRLRPEIRVLFTSGYTDDAIVRHGVLDADVAFLQKPFTPGQLVARVREALDAPLRR